jgi:hypothetical protein
MTLMQRSLFEQWLLLFCAFVSVGSGSALAHSMYQSAVLLDFHGNTVQAELQLPVDRLSISFRQAVDESHFAAERSELQSYVLAHVHPVTSDGRPFSVQFASMKIETVEKAPYLVVHVVFTPPAKTNVDLFTLNYDVITHEIVTHVVLVSIRSDSQAHIPLNDPLLIGVIRGERKSIVVDRMRIL